MELEDTTDAPAVAAARSPPLGLGLQPQAAEHVLCAMTRCVRLEGQSVRSGERVPLQASIGAFGGPACGVLRIILFWIRLY